MYTHFTRDDRVVISDGLRHGESYAMIGSRIGKNKGAVWREVQRNSDLEGTYDARSAHKRAQVRRKQSKQAYRKIENNTVLRKQIELLLHPLRSPEVIAYELGIVHQTIYSWIERSRKDLSSKLPYQGKKRRRYGTKRQQKQGWTRHIHAIGERPAGAAHRSRIGHFEGDTLRGSSGALLTHTDRKSRFEIAVKIPNETADVIHAAIVNHPQLAAARSFTFDRGSGFALWQLIEEDTHAHVYFADPHAPWQRGSNENSNGRLRWVYPKETNFTIIPQEEIDANVWIMNHTPRKCLGWRTPCAVYGKCCTSS